MSTEYTPAEISGFVDDSVCLAYVYWLLEHGYLVGVIGNSTSFEDFKHKLNTSMDSGEFE